VFTFNNMDEALTFVGLVTRRIKSKELLIRYDVGNGVRVYVALQDEPHEIELYSMELRRIYSDIKMMRDKHGVRVYDISLILNKAKLEAAIPIDIVIDALQLMGIDVELNGSKIRVKNGVKLEDLVNMAEEVSKLYSEMADMSISAQAKRIIAIYSLLTKKGIRDGIEDLLEHRILAKYGDTELLVLSMDYDHALLRLQELIEKREKHK